MGRKEEILYATLELAAENGMKNGTVLWPLRTAVSGKQATPSGATGIMELLGKEESLRRLREALADKEPAGKPIKTKSVIDGQEVSGYQITDQDEFSRQLSELYETEVDIDLMQVSGSILDQLDSDRYDPLTPAQIHDTGWMITTEG